MKVWIINSLRDKIKIMMPIGCNKEPELLIGPEVLSDKSRLEKIIKTVLDTIALD